MTTIYSVSSGEYSDYSIEGLFTSKERAEEIVEAMNGHHKQAFVEEFELDPEVASPPKDRFQYEVQIHNERVQYVRRESIEMDKIGERPKSFFIRNSCGREGPFFVINCLARDEAHATKIAVDTFRVVKALRQHQNPEPSYELRTPIPDEVNMEPDEKV